MSNMSYCRFQNTETDLRDCWHHIHETENLSEDERRARKRLIELCQQIVEETTDLDDDDDDE